MVPSVGALDYKRYSLSGAPNTGNLDYKWHSLQLVHAKVPKHGFSLWRIQARNLRLYNKIYGQDN